MLKTVLLLTFAVFVSSATMHTPAQHIHKTLLGELIDELNIAMKDFPKEKGVKPIFLRDLDVKCNSQEEREVFFCQAEQELIKEVSGLSAAKFDHFRTDKKLMRNLNKYNNHNEGNNTSLKDEIRNTTLSAESDDEQDKAVKDVPKVTEEAKILVEDKICDKTLKGKPDDELVTAMKNVPKETE
ncbi:interleukin 4 13A [Labeo rohita]|uniref:Interleukin 4 13A n=1 Tax=Labeo rohita TaxID=84645 RepID=A0A498N1R5_LABRO|nr:interleukin 4 13A [Labeo rohita]